MNKKVIIDNSLHEHIKFLKQSGYQVEEIDNFRNSKEMESFNYDAVVVSSMNDLPMNATSFRPGAPVVEVENKTPEELFNVLRGRY